MPPVSLRYNDHVSRCGRGPSALRPVNSAALQSWLEHFGIAVSAITGVLAARGKRIDLFGALVLALVTAFGGGTVRDLLVGDTPVGWLRAPGYLLNATASALVAFYVARLWNFPRQVLLVADAFALALFTMIGARKGVALQFSGSVAVLLGVATGVGAALVLAMRLAGIRWRLSLPLVDVRAPAPEMTERF